MLVLIVLVCVAAALAARFASGLRPVATAARVVLLALPLFFAWVVVNYAGLSSFLAVGGIDPFKAGAPWPVLYFYAPPVLLAAAIVCRRKPSN
jgi:hypothetical protein